MKHQTFIAWTNFLARSKHGAMNAWDHWTESGSPGAIELPGAQPKPAGGSPDPTRNNIAPNNNSGLLENIQRPMQEDAFGVLEIFVDAYGHVIDRPGYRMRLDHVGPKVRAQFRTAGKVRDLPVNKIVHMCSHYHNGVRVDPPASIASVLITADGYVRASNWSEFQRMHFEPKNGPLGPDGIRRMFGWHHRRQRDRRLSHRPQGDAQRNLRVRERCPGTTAYVS